MGEGEGGGGQDKDPLVPPPLHPLPPRGGEILRRICLINYGLLSKSPLIPLFQRGMITPPFGRRPKRASGPEGKGRLGGIWKVIL